MPWCKICGDHMPGQTPHVHSEEKRRLSRYDEAIRLLRAFNDRGMALDVLLDAKKFLATEPKKGSDYE